MYTWQKEVIVDVFFNQIGKGWIKYDLGTNIWIWDNYENRLEERLKAEIYLLLEKEISIS